VPGARLVIEQLGADYQLRLTDNGCEVTADISATGGALRRLRIAGVDITPEIADGQPPPFSFGTVLAPWPNRIRDGRWTYRGSTRQLDITDPVHHSALHGLLRESVHVPVAHSDSSLTLAAPIFPRRGYPFSLDAEVTYALEADGVTVTQRVHNTGSVPAPVAIGAHPFLTIGDVDPETLVLSVNATRHVDIDASRIPIGMTDVPNTRWDLRTGRKVGDLDLDDAWARSASEGNLATLTAPDGRAVSLWADATFAFVHVFITRLFPSTAGMITAVALEPMTAPADTFNNGVGLRWVRPGDVMSASWAIRYHDAGER